MLLAATNHICQDVAVVPLLWVVPLSLYLLSFIICFDHSRWYVRPAWTSAAVLALVGTVACDLSKRLSLSLGLVIVLGAYFLALFCVCMVCHGELVRRKPAPRYLTEFYLLVATGGALGGVLVGIVAPLVFKSYVEWQIGVDVSFVLCVGLLLLRDFVRRTRLVNLIGYLVFGFFAAVALSQVMFLVSGVGRLIDRERNFFGVIFVTDVKEPGDPDEPFRALINGSIRHGSQFRDPAKRRLPTSYYGESSGVGRAIRYLQKAGPVHIGAIGLGTGTLATYVRPGDSLVFYEINPAVVRMAEQYFTYLSDCRARRRGAGAGDGRCARLSLENDLVAGPAKQAEAAGKPPQPFDLLVVDAFSGDAIPTHLLTREALVTYCRHLAPRGVVAFHVSNNYLRLGPVVRRLGEDCGMRATRD